MDTTTVWFNILSAVFGLASAGSWLRAGIVKIAHEDAMKRRAAIAKHKGEQPNFSSVSFDGWDMTATFAAQSKWNAIGAFCAAGAISLQTYPQLSYIFSK